MTNLEKLENDIRQKLPRLMELTEGCKIAYKSNILRIFFRRVCEIGLLRINGIAFWIYEKSKDIDFIVGHDPMLNDVLEWFNIIESDSEDFCITSEGRIKEWEYEGYAGFNNPCWDLSKPYLKDQPQELIDYLAGLI